MRSPNTISNIKKHISDPQCVETFLTPSDINHLIKIFYSTNNCETPYIGKIKKNTGPITLDIRNFKDDYAVKKIIDLVQTHIGRFEITAGFFFETDYPHIIHNDDTFELPDNVFKAITIPLKIYGENPIDYPSLCFFDQFYFHGPAKFFKGEKFIPTYYNKQVYDYGDVDNLTENKFDHLLYQNYFSHLKYSWLDGLSFQGAIKWVPGNAIIFDSVRLHCASDFRKQGITKKLGISIFTKKLTNVYAAD